MVREPMGNRSDAAYRHYILAALVLFMAFFSGCNRAMLRGPRGYFTAEPLATLDTRAPKVQPIGVVLDTPLTLSETRRLLERLNAPVYSIHGYIGNSSGTLRIPKGESPARAYRMFVSGMEGRLRVGKEHDRLRLLKLMEKYGVRKLSEREARSIFVREKRLQHFVCSYLARIERRELARAVLSGKRPVVYAFQVGTRPGELKKALQLVTPGKAKGVVYGAPAGHLHPERPAYVEEAQRALLERNCHLPPGDLFEKAKSALRSEYGIVLWGPE